MKQIADYKFILNYEGKEYKYNDKILMDIFDNRCYISFRINKNPFRYIFASKKMPEILIVLSNDYGVVSFKKINNETTHFDYSKNNYIFQLIKNLNNMCSLQSMLNFNLTSNNCTNMYSQRFKISRLEKWADEITENKVNIYKMIDNVNIVKCGYAELEIELNKGKILGMLV